MNDWGDQTVQVGKNFRVLSCILRQNIMAPNKRRCPSGHNAI